MPVENYNYLTGQDIFTSELSIYLLEAVRPSLFWVRVHLTGLANSGANITIKVYFHTAAKGDYLIYSTGAIAKPIDTDQNFVWCSPQPFYIPAAGGIGANTIEVKVLSSNGGDASGVDTYCWIVDPYADGYDANDIRKVSVEDWGDTDVSDKVSGGYVQVDSVKIGSQDPQSIYDLETTVAVSDTALSFTLSAGKASADAHDDITIEVEDADDSNIEQRRITGWTAGKVVTVNREFSFIPAVGDKVRFPKGSHRDEDSNVIKWKGSAPADLVSGDVKATLDGEEVTPTAASKTGYKLASDGLDTVSTAEPAGVAANFREMMVQVWRRLFKKKDLTSTELKCYKDDGSSVATTQSVSDDGTTETQGAAT